MFKKLNKKGFTLAELLVVVAIVGVLVAISIPIFTNQLEKAREATDLANIRAAYAECSAEALTADTGSVYAVQKAVDIKQTTSGWMTTGYDMAGVTTLPDVAKGNKIYVTVYCDGSKPTYTTSDSAVTAAPTTGGTTIKKLS